MGSVLLQSDTQDATHTESLAMPVLYMLEIELGDVASVDESKIWAATVEVSACKVVYGLKVGAYEVVSIVKTHLGGHSSVT